ncbi:MAG TPA: hypothetical protein VGK13_03910 [Methanocellaceae archaeon]
MVDYKEIYIEDRIEEQLSSCERFAEEQLRKPEHRRVMIGIKRLNNALTSLKTGWQSSSRQHALSELESVLIRQHEIELQIEKIDNMFLREYVHELLDKMATARRAMAEEVRWDVESERSGPRTQYNGDVQGL